MNLASPLERSKHTNTSYLKKKKNPHFYLLVLDQRFLRKIKYRKIIIMHFFIINLEQLVVSDDMFKLYLETFSSYSNVYRTQIITTCCMADISHYDNLTVT